MCQVAVGAWLSFNACNTRDLYLQASLRIKSAPGEKVQYALRLINS